jgi:small subunit ribosomal protein S1
VGDADTAGQAETGSQVQPVNGGRSWGRGGREEAPKEERILEQGGDIPDYERDRRPIDYGETLRALNEGDVVRGTVVHIDREGILVDIGTKAEGLVPLGELSRDHSRRAEQIVRVGEEIDVLVMNVDEEQTGQIILSKRRADFEKAWDQVIEAQRAGETIEAVVTERVKGGLVVDLGIRGFVPASHVGSGKARNLERYVGESLPLKVIEVDRDRRKVVLSHRLATEEEREAQRQETLQTLSEGQVRKGVVRRITDYGAFVDIGGVDGLLHISEMSWTRVKHPSDVLKVGDEIQVMVLKTALDQSQPRISLGLRQILPDPWTEAQEKFQPGTIVEGTVTRLVPFGAFVAVDGGVEGIVPNNELALHRVAKPEDVVQVGDQLKVKILDIRPEEHRLTLSVRQALEEGEYADYQPGAPDRVTLGDVVGDQLAEAREEAVDRADTGEAEAPAEEPAEEATEEE